jgi:hypothetical protein
MDVDKAIDMLLESVSGEFWVDDMGQAVYADGDIGDKNHEMIVIESILYGHDVDPEEYEADYSTIAKVINKVLSLQPLWSEEEMLPNLKEEFDEFTDDQLENLIGEAPLFTKDELAVLEGDMDARDYGLKYLGWIRIKGNEVQVYELTDGDQLKTVINALYDQGEIEDEPEAEETFNIEVIKTKVYYTDVPMSTMEDGNLSSLRVYA